MQSNKIIIVTTVLLCLLFTKTESYSRDTKDSVIQVINNISAGFRHGDLSDKQYMDSIYVTMRQVLSDNIHFSNKELLNMLNEYRKTIWNSKDNFEYKRDYYGILSNQAQASTRYGEMVYYGEKIDLLEQQYNNRPSLTGLAIILDYYMVHMNYKKAVEIYEPNKEYLQNIPSLATAGKIKVNELVQSVIVLHKVARSFYELYDIKNGKEAEETIAVIAKIAEEKHADNYNVIANISFLQNETFYYGATARKDSKLQQVAFGRMAALLTDTNTPEYLKFYIDISLTDWKVNFYLANKNNDSAAIYINKYEQLAEGEDIAYNLYLLKKTKAQELYNKQNYKEGFDMLLSAGNILDTTRRDLVNDIDDMLYARAKSEEQEILLQEAAIKSKRTANIIRYTILVSVLIIGSIVFLLWYMRMKQKRQFLEFKLNMARNIHDETGPALLYAKSLAKASRTGNDEGLKLELERHLDTTMATIRGLSHDLKSAELHSVSDLIKTVEQTLKKLKAVNEFKYKVENKTGTDRFISHYQFSQLKAILQECIANSIKHSEFDMIEVRFVKDNNKLTISYKDNGKGWDTQYEKDGIGMKNMEERSQQINGNLSISSHYPNGYEIILSVLLR